MKRLLLVLALTAIAAIALVPSPASEAQFPPFDLCMDCRTICPGLSLDEADMTVCTDRCTSTVDRVIFCNQFHYEYGPCRYCEYS